MPGRTLCISLLVGIICCSAATTEDKASPGQKKDGAARSAAEPKKEFPPVAPAPAAQDSEPEKELKELKAKVEALATSVKRLEDPQRLDALKRLDSDVQRLGKGLTRASWIVPVIFAAIPLILLWLWIATKRLAGAAQVTQAVADARAAMIQAVTDLQAHVTGDVNAARDQVLARVTETGTNLQGRLDNTLQAVTNVRTEVTDARTALWGRVGDVLTAVNEARGVAHQDAMDLRQGLTEIRGTLQATPRPANGRDGAAQKT